MSSIETTQQTRARRFVALLLALMTLLGSTAAFAQDKKQGQGDDQDLPSGPLEEELEDYWSVDRDVAVIRNKLYRREGRFGLGLHFGLMSSEPFFWYLPVGLRANYYFSDNFGIELEGSYMGAEGVLRHETDLTNFVRDQRPGFDPDLDALDQLSWRASAMATWHPLYGKLAVLQRKLTHFDFNLAAGLGAVGLDRPTPNRQANESKVLPEFAFGGGVDFFLSRKVVLRLIGRGYLYPGPKQTHNTELGFTTVSAVEGEGSKDANFFQRLEFTTQFLVGFTYMF